MVVLENQTQEEPHGRKNFTDDEFNYELEFWMCTGFSVPLAIGALYLFLAQFAFCVIKTKRATRRRTKRRDSQPSTVLCRSRSHRTQIKNAIVLNTMSVLGTACAFLRAGVDFRLAFGKNTAIGCELSIKFKLMNYVLSLVSIYMVLWLRQKIFYEHPRLRHLSSKFIRFISWSMSIAIIAGVIVTSALFFGVGKYVADARGCKVQPGPFVTIRWILLISYTTFFQVCLLALFIYPLCKHKTGMRSAVSGKNTNVVIPLIQRATISSVLCVISDIGFALLILVMKKEIVTMSTFVYDVNITFNALCMVLSFPDWRIRLMPWTLRETGNLENDLSTDGTTRQRTSETNIVQEEATV